jgi:hypothetical protein
MNISLHIVLITLIVQLISVSNTFCQPFIPPECEGKQVVNMNFDLSYPDDDCHPLCDRTLIGSYCWDCTEYGTMITNWFDWADFTGYLYCLDGCLEGDLQIDYVRQILDNIFQDLKLDFDTRVDKSCRCPKNGAPIQIKQKWGYSFIMTDPQTGGNRLVSLTCTAGFNYICVENPDGSTEWVPDWNSWYFDQVCWYTTQQGYKVYIDCPPGTNCFPE